MTPETFQQLMWFTVDVSGLTYAWVTSAKHTDKADVGRVE